MLKHLGEVLPVAAQRFGDKTALVFEGRAFSYRELDRLSNRLANALSDMGVAAGDRVSLYCGNSWEWIVAYYAAAKAGAAINPINVMLTPEEVKFVTRDCQARIILSSADKGEALLAVQKDTPLEYVILFGDGAKGGKSFDDLISGGRDSYEPKPIPADTTSTIGYTSGTTGHPKGAMTTHRAVLLNSSMTANGWMFTAADTAVSALPCSHVYGNIIMNGTFLTGGTLVLMPRFDAERALGLIAEHRATHFHGVPTMHMYVLNTPTQARYDLSSLTRCTVGGQTMPVSKMEEAEARYGCPLLEIWGMTEIAGAGTLHPFYGDNRLGSIGLPITYTECRIADAADATKTLPDGEIGELMLRGPIVMQGYFGNDRATKETIEPDGWLHSGDIARRDRDGYYYIVDRKKDMIITAGFNVYPAEIERVLASHPSVAMVAVGSQPDALKGEAAKAYVVLRVGAVGDADALMAHCREQLAAYKVPRAIQFVADLPKTSTGKILRRELKKLDEQNARAGAAAAELAPS
jgi:long-chain acyl-CoA synthetase